MVDSQSEIILWGVSVSPFVRKVLVALEEKGINYVQKETLPVKFLEATNQQIPADFKNVSPLGKIPALQYGEYSIADSAAINVYLEKKFPDTVKLYPESAQFYAQAIWFETFGDYTLAEIATGKIFYELFAKPKVLTIAPDYEVVDQAKNEALPPLLDYLEKSIGKSEWLVDNNFSVADIAIATHFVNLKLCEYEIDHQRWPNLSSYINKILMRESFEKAIS